MLVGIGVAIAVDVGLGVSVGVAVGVLVGVAVAGGLELFVAVGNGVAVLVDVDNGVLWLEQAVKSKLNMINRIEMRCVIVYIYFPPSFHLAYLGRFSGAMSRKKGLAASRSEMIGSLMFQATLRSGSFQATPFSSAPPL